MKPFDLEAAKAGKPVKTRSGQPVRILAYDLKEPIPIVAMYGKEEIIRRYTNEGRSHSYLLGDKDLVMDNEYVEFWVNLYTDTQGNVHAGEYTFRTDEDAESGRNKLLNFLKRKKIRVKL